MFNIELDIKESSLISEIEYNEETEDLKISFRKYYVEHLTYCGVPMSYFIELTEAKSIGRFYLNYIKPNFKLKITKMARRIIKFKIDVNMINKDYLFTGETKNSLDKPRVYLNFTGLIDDEDNAQGNCAMLIQDVPSKIYKEEVEDKVPKDKMTKGNILGNGKEFQKTGGAIPNEAKPGVEAGKAGVNKEIDDDLPF